MVGTYVFLCSRGLLLIVREEKAVAFAVLGDGFYLYIPRLPFGTIREKIITIIGTVSSILYIVN